MPLVTRVNKAGKTAKPSDCEPATKPVTLPIAPWERADHEARLAAEAAAAEENRIVEVVRKTPDGGFSGVVKRVYGSYRKCAEWHRWDTHDEDLIGSRLTHGLRKRMYNEYGGLAGVHKAHRTLADLCRESYKN